MEATTTPIPLRASGRHQKSSRRQSLRFKVKRLHRDALLPQYCSAGAAGLDLCAMQEEAIFFGDGPKYINTGIAVEIPEGYIGLLSLRSSAAKLGLYMPNAPGIIDSDDRGELKVLVCATGPDDVLLEVGQRIAQLVVIPCAQVEVEEADKLGETKRGTGGCGSTGC